MAGITATGFEKLRLPEIRAAIYDDYRNRLRAAGFSDDIDTRPDSITGLLVDTFAEREAAMWELSEALYYAMYPLSADSVTLDRATSFTGVSRIQAEYSRVILTLYGTQGTTVPAGSQARDSITQTVWQTEQAGTITKSAAKDVRIAPTVADSTAYTITIDTTAYTYTSGTGATLASVIAGIKQQFVATLFNVTDDGATVRIVVDTAPSMALSVGTNLTITEIGSPVQARSLEKKPLVADAGNIDTIITGVAGWDRVSNLQDAVIGRATETDAELRARYNDGVYRLGAAILPSIKPNILQNVPGVTAVSAFENATDAVDAAGNKPHSIHVIVAGGIDEQVARAIYEVKAAGIDTNGATSVTFNSDEGQQTILFDRPTNMYIWVEVVITLLPIPEGEDFPATGFDEIQQAIVDHGETLGIGNNVIRERFYADVFSVPGVASATIKMYGTTNINYTPVSGDYAESNILIDNTQVAHFSLNMVSVT